MAIVEIYTKNNGCD